MLVTWGRLLAIVDGTAKHCDDQLFRYCSTGGDAAMPGGLHARICHALLVIIRKDSLEVAPTTLLVIYSLQVANRSSPIDMHTHAGSAFLTFDLSISGSMHAERLYI